MLRAVQLGAGTRVLVTGASRGIGQATARAFASRGLGVNAANYVDDFTVPAGC